MGLDVRSVEVLSPQSDRSLLLAEVRDGLGRRQRELPSRLLADPATAALRRRLDAVAARRFAAVEWPLATSVAATLAAQRPFGAVIDVGARAVAGTAAVLETLAAHGALTTYVVADAALAPARDAVDHVHARLPSLETSLLVADTTLTLPLVRQVPRPRLYLALGNTLGDHTTIAALRLLRTLRSTMSRGDALLLGVDVRSDGKGIERELHEELATRTAYHRHALTVLRVALNAVVDPERFEYAARYDAQLRRADVQLVAREACTLVLPDGAAFELRRGEGVRTGVHSTFDRGRLGALLDGVGLAVAAWHEHDSGDHAVVVARPAM
jgi:L-histidine N-alpha-methyltransferase